MGILVEQRDISKMVSIDQVYFKLEKEVGSANITANIHLSNYGDKDSNDVDLEVFIRNTSKSKSSAMYDVKVSKNDLKIKNGKTLNVIVTFSIRTGKYIVELRLYENGLHRETDKQAITIYKEDVKPEGSMAQTEIPEFSTVLVPILSTVIIYYLLIYKKRRNGRDDGS